MALRESLEPRVTKLKIEARAAYATYLRSKGLRADEDGRLELNTDPHAGTLPDVDIKEEQKNFSRYLSDVDALAGRFETYYELSSSDLYAHISRLGGQCVKGRVVTTPPDSPYNVSGHLHYASDHWVLKVSELVDKDLWLSDAATAFRRKFLGPFRDAAAWQMACTKILGMAVQAFRDTTADMEKNLAEIVDAATSRLKGEGRDGESGSLAVFSLVAGAAGMFLPTGWSQVAGVASVISGFASLFAETEGEDEKWQIDGLNAPQIIHSTWEQLNKLERAFADLDDVMYKGLHKDRFSPQAFASPELTLGRPTIADDHTEFGEMGYVQGANELVVIELTNIYRAGYVRLPAAANEYKAALKQLAAVSPPKWLSLLLPRTSAEFDRARVDFTRVLISTGSSPRDSGASLVKVAKEYELTDEQSASLLRKIGNIPQPIYIPPLDSGIR